MGTSIKVLHISPRVESLLIRIGIKTVEDLIKIDDDYDEVKVNGVPVNSFLANLRGIGAVKGSEIMYKLEEFRRNNNY